MFLDVQGDHNPLEWLQHIHFFRDQWCAKILKHHSGISGQWVNLRHFIEDFTPVSFGV